jgi:hypothetical protein
MDEEYVQEHILTVVAFRSAFSRHNDKALLVWPVVVLVLRITVARAMQHAQC